MNGALFGEAFVTLTVIMDPLGTVPIFLALSAGRPAKVRRRMAWQSVCVALLVITVFAVFGQQILRYLGITLPALQGAGGLLLALVALELLRGGGHDPEELPDVNIALVPLGTPLLAGPGAIAATILFVRESDGRADLLAVGAAIVAVHAVLYLALRFSGGVLFVLREAGIHLLTRIFGLLLAAIAVQLVADSVIAFAAAS
ncbi:MAG TPA: MarC family protein [Mycobacteriales bacterium]|nr:MarC family protein [Mycobacteriales bacterium]